jgi:hypothetical protein
MFVDLPILYEIQQFFGGIGRIHHSLTMVSFHVSRRQDLVFVILPHFKDYPLLTQKSIDFQLFSSIIELRNKGLHRRRVKSNCSNESSYEYRIIRKT